MWNDANSGAPRFEDVGRLELCETRSSGRVYSTAHRVAWRAFGHVAVVALFGVSACESSTPEAPGARIELAVAPLELAGVTNATYTLTVRNKSGQTVFTRGLDSRTYGDGAGSLSYVGPCDADPAENPNTVSLTLTALYGGSAGDTLIGADTYRNPGELTRPINCVPNADTLVAFDLTIARDAQQGFFDVAVTFEDIFCSAKLDCVDEAGDVLRLLHAPQGDRGRSVVLGLACTGDLSASGETFLYRAPIVVSCAGGPATIDPSAGPGNLSAGNGYVTTGTAPIFGAAVYRGEEQFSFDKRYWNVVVGLADTAQSCTISTRATASPEAFANGNTPANTSWPYIVWSRALTNAASATTCTRHPVDGEAPNDGVYTTYTSVSAPQTFPFIFGPTAQVTPCVAGQTTCAYASCEALQDAGLAQTDGVYAIDPDGPNAGEPAFETHCDQTTDGGGWTLVRVSNGTTTPDLRVETAVNLAGLAGGPSANTNAQLASSTVNSLGNVFMAINTAAGYDTRVWYDRMRACNPQLTSLRWLYSSALPSVASCPSASSVYPPSENRWGQDVGGGTHINMDASHPLCFGSWAAGSKGHFCYNRNSFDWWNYGTNAATSGNGSARTALYVRSGPVACVVGQTTCTLASCKAILDAGLSSGTGVYAIDPDGPNTGAPAFEAYCDMTTDGGGWTLVSRHFGGSLANAGPVGVLSSPTQSSNAKLADTTINALRGSFATSVFRFSCGDGTSYFQQDQAFVANAPDLAALQRCAASWNATTWYTATPWHNHFGLNTYQVAGSCGGYQIWDYAGGTCYPSGYGVTWVKGP